MNSKIFNQILKHNRQMIKNSSSRRRQFSDVRSYLNSSHSHFYPDEQNTTRQQISANPTKAGKWNIARDKRTVNNRRKFNELNLSIGISAQKQFAENIKQNNQQQHAVRHTTRQICVSCVNKLAADKKTKEKRLKQKKVKEEQNCSARKKELNWGEIERQQTKRNKKQKQILRQNVSKVQKNKQHALKQKQVEAAKIRQLQEKFREQCQREINLQNQKKKMFNHELKMQIEERKQQKRLEEKIQKSNFKDSYSQEVINLISDKKEELKNQYKKGLQQQIKDKQQRISKQMQQQKRADQENRRILKQPSLGFTNTYASKQSQLIISSQKQYSKDLLQQIEYKKQLKRKQHMEDIKKEEQQISIAEKQVQKHLLLEKSLRGKAIQNYICQLKNQIQSNRNKRAQQKEMEKASSFLLVSNEVKQQKLENCQNCHYKFPKKYLSTIEND